MWNEWRSRWELVVRCTDLPSLLNALTDAGVPFEGAHPLDEVRVYMEVPYGQVHRVRSLLELHGSELMLCRPYGFMPEMLRLGKRTALLVSGVLCFLLLAASNLFVWRIDVTGNEQVARGDVVRAMTEAGAGVGSFWPSFDAEQLRTQLLLDLEEVQWLSVNYKSGAVEVVLREKKPVPEVIDNDEPVHIVADRGGLVTSLAVKQGQPCVSVGDTVEEGQLLISGAAASTVGGVRTVHALGQIRGRTWHALSVRMPTQERVKVWTGRRSLKISVILQGNRLNFYGNSSIFGDTCDTITMDYHLCMNGVFALPVRIVVQRCEYWDLQERETDRDLRVKLGRDALMEALQQRLGETGQVLTVDFAAKDAAECTTVTVMAECLQELGKEVPISASQLSEIQRQNILGEETTND